MSDKTTVAVLGGSGAEGSGLALRIAHAGYTVVIGSREASRAIDAARAIAAQTNGGRGAGPAKPAAAPILSTPL